MPTIKRYPNRKLYDTEAKRYVTLDQLTGMIQAGEEVQVVDHESGDDLTTLTLTQIILEQEKKRSGFLPQHLLTGLIRAGGDTVEQLIRSIQIGVNRPSADDPAEQTQEQTGDGSENRDDQGEGASSVERARQIADERLTEMLHLINVPSRREVEALQVQLAVLSQRLEEMVEEQDEQADSQIDDAESESEPS